MVKKITSIILCISLIGCFVSGSAYANENDLHPTGLKWDSIETIDSHLNDAPRAVSYVPDKVDLTDQFPLPGDQGNQGSCTAWAVGYALKSCQENNKRGWTVNTEKHNFSPSFVYNQLSSNDSGIHVSAAMDLIKNSGICSLKYFQYNEDDYYTQPSSTVKAAAKLYKSAYWNTIEGIVSIKNHLIGGDGVVVGIQVYPDFDNLSASNPIYDNAAGTSRGGHAICLIGYDDSKEAFKFINSWGTDWGLSGYGWISYDLLNNASVNYYGTAVGYVMGPATDDYFLGDVDQNGVVESGDSLLILQHTTKVITLSDRQFALADVDGNSVVDATDANAVLNYVVKNIDHMPLYD